MSANDDQIQVEAKSSIKVTRNAKGDAQFEAKVVDGATEPELNEHSWRPTLTRQLRRLAVHQYRELVRETRWCITLIHTAEEARRYAALIAEFDNDGDTVILYCDLLRTAERAERLVPTVLAFEGEMPKLLTAGATT